MLLTVCIAALLLFALPGHQSRPPHTVQILPAMDESYNAARLSNTSSLAGFRPTDAANRPGVAPRVVHVTIASGFEDILFERAIETHVSYAERHGYPFYIAREEAARGMFNKIAYLMNVVLTELNKSADQRCEWIFYSDADTIIMNPEIPLEIFIPPSDFGHINWLAGRDWNGLNAGVLFLRVARWSLTLLVRAMTYQHHHPGEDYTFEEQSVLAKLTETDMEFRRECLYIPRKWFNAYYHHPINLEPGLLLAHFPHPDYKWHMYKWLRVEEDERGLVGERSYRLPLSKTIYPTAIREFWDAMRHARTVVQDFERIRDEAGNQRVADRVGVPVGQCQLEYDRLLETLERDTDEPVKLEHASAEAEDVSRTPRTMASAFLLTQSAVQRKDGRSCRARRRDVKATTVGTLH